MLSAEKLASASVEELRATISDLQAAWQEAKMTAAHHKLQYQMLSQESASALERRDVEAHMAQCENRVIHGAKHARATAPPVQPSALPEGMIHVQKDLYQRMVAEVQQLRAQRHDLIEKNTTQQLKLDEQEYEIASLSDKVMLMRERIRENRDHIHRQRQISRTPYIDSTPRSTYNDPLRNGFSSQEQPQPFAALLQASEMASQEARRPLGAKKGHSRNTHSMSSLPTTPNRSSKQQPIFYTPSGRQPPLKIPSTAPVPRTSALRTPDIYAQQALPVPKTQGPPSDGTVSAHEDDDSEAETDIIEQDDHDAITESQASRQASQMLRSSQEQQAKRDSFKGSGMLQSSGEKLKQSKLFGAVRKANVDRSGEPSAKRQKTSQPAIGLGIAGVRQ